LITAFSSVQSGLFFIHIIVEEILSRRQCTVVSLVEVRDWASRPRIKNLSHIDQQGAGGHNDAPNRQDVQDPAKPTLL
jgi:hypothetical protein